MFFARVALVDKVYFKAIKIEYKRKFFADLENEVTSCFILKILTCIVCNKDEVYPSKY